MQFCATLFFLTNEAEAILEARLFQSESPPDHSTECGQRLQGGSQCVWDVTDGHVRASIVHHHIGVEVVAGELNRGSRVAHVHFSVKFSIRPLRLSCEK